MSQLEWHLEEVLIEIELGNSKNVCENPIFIRHKAFLGDVKKKKLREKKVCEMNVIYFNLHLPCIILHQTQSFNMKSQ